MQRTKRIVDLLPETDIAFQKETFSRNRLLYNVTQIGVCVGGVRHSISRERYDAFALFYLREGAALLEYDGKTFRAEAGDLLFWDQKKPHTLRNAGNAPFTADFAYLFALRDPDAMISVVSMVRRGSVVVSFLCGAVLFRERNLRSKAVDLAFILVGMFFLWLGSRPA